MDGAVSWHMAVLLAKLHFPNADQSTIIQLAKEIYLASQNDKLKATEDIEAG
ncbi:MAG: hypothetical protein Q8936_05990 [Bacillota bacterium]|nr:hypothetical protein [Bacillota bacterium]